MDERIKQRLVGAVVLVSLVVIFAPMLLEKEPVVEPGIHESNIPEPPQGFEQFRSGVLPSPGQDLGPAVEPARLAAPSAPTPASAAVATKPDSQPAVTAPAPAEPVSVIKPAPVALNARARTSPPEVKAAAAPPTPRVGVSAWVVQLGAFAKRDNADSLVQRLKKDRQEAFMDQVDVGRTTLFRVRVGPELDHKRAEAMLAAVRKSLGADAAGAQVVRYP